MQPPALFRVTFWGVTGSYPRPHTAADLRTFQADAGQPDPITFGGDTTCIQIEADDQLFIVDAGTGLQRLSQSLESAGRGRTSRRGALFLTHAHLDHVCALPFFEPFFDPRAQFVLYGAPRTIEALQAVGKPGEPLAGVFFPQALDQMPGLARCETLQPGEAVASSSVTITTFALNHPGGSLAYRFDFADKRVVIATDHEQTSTPDGGLADFARDADLLYMDAQYLREEYEGRVSVAGESPQSRGGWGHTPLEDCLPTAVAANAKRLFLGHHEPRRNDAALRAIAESLPRIQQATPGAANVCVELAYQGLSITL